MGENWSLGEQVVLIDDIPIGNHQTNAINVLPNGTLIWHSGSTATFVMKTILAMLRCYGLTERPATTAS